MLNRILGEILSHSQENKSLIAVRKNNDMDSTWVGFIVNFNENLFVLQHISPLGYEDGLIVEKIANVDNFETNDEYLKGIERLYRNGNLIAKQVVDNIEISEEEDWQYEILKSAFDQGRIIALEINNNDSLNYGFLVDFDDISLKLRIVDKIGKEDGLQTYCLADITSLAVDRIEGRKREALYELRKKSTRFLK
jgi:hypothetical protein